MLLDEEEEEGVGFFLVLLLEPPETEDMDVALSLSLAESESESDSTAGSRFGFVEVGGNGERMAAEGKPSKRSGEETDHERDAKRARQAETEMREQREEISRRKKAMLVVRGTEEVGRDQLLQKLEEWRGVGCSICWAQGQIQRARRARSWKQCAEHSREAEERMEETLRKVESLKIARFSGCQFCWAPQSICLTKKQRRGTLIPS